MTKRTLPIDVLDQCKKVLGGDWNTLHIASPGECLVVGERTQKVATLQLTELFLGLFNKEWMVLSLSLSLSMSLYLVGKKNPNNNLAILLGRYVIFLFRKQQTRVVGRVFLSVCNYSTYRSLNMLPTEQKLVEQHFLVGCPQLGQQHMSRQSNI